MLSPSPESDPPVQMAGFADSYGKNRNPALTDGDLAGILITVHQQVRILSQLYMRMNDPGETGP